MKPLLGRSGVILIGLVILSYAEAWGADWRLYTFNDLVANYYDADSIILPFKDIVRVLEKTTYTDKAVIDCVRKFGTKYANLSYSTTLEEINCVEKTRHLLTGNYYDKNGKLIASDSSPTEWLSIIPESTDNALYKAICK